MIVSAAQQSSSVIHICMYVHICMYLHTCMYPCMHSKSLQSRPTFWDPRTVAHQVPRSMGFSRQEYWNGLPCPLPGGPPDPGNGSASLVSPALAGGFFTTSTTWEMLHGSILPETPLPSRLPHNMEFPVLNSRYV